MLAAASQCGESLCGEPRALALEFKRTLQEQPDLIGMGVSSFWVRNAYRSFCRAQGLVFPPAYRLFAEELARVIPRRREDIRAGGQRVRTATFYRVPAPTSVVVELAVERKRA